MINISCQQLTEGLSRIQELKKECDDGATDRINDIKLIKRLKDGVKEIFNSTFVEGKGGRRIYFRDYNIIKNYLLQNGLEYTVDYIHTFAEVNEKFHVKYITLLLPQEEKFVKGACEFKKLNYLNSLNLSETKFPSDQSFLKEFKTIKNLYLSYSDFSDLESIKSLPDLKVLDLEGCMNIYDFSPLISMNLEKIYILGTRLDENFHNLDQKDKDLLYNLKQKGVEVVYG